ncbi:adenosyl cobinamide kinase/adenosyl cobinamide phosphate guanylyltransferase [Endobacter medicaginis]|uniref:Adenosyl cobinamide kinase/adenosyl cobinamide phosphate guanylyltransferase n=1 Tax=Endobacter medicaginis TaxID=1181271 RepID=A0A850NUE7_9PROT|nr:hypothetical protein [Endobacter medicaginis]MBB3173994.1 adenosyl cobinamide kinase/adenosyl cobinamide phosphate guanylyltransferase [Endobacter medicaginis]MCX5475148.1 hypothetical protein [Endobacter medicaginis]NVN31062.1 hypothetical protein [Endobacter medicaginis]
MELSSKTDAELDRWIANHEERKLTETPLYRSLLEERARRSQLTHKLRIDRSMELLKNAALMQVCTTYGALAQASDVPWSLARRQMDGANGHLDRLSDLCHARGLPFLTALVVNQQDVETGVLKGEALRGFIACARRLNHLITDEVAFHQARRDECWAWGRAQTGD